MNITNLLKKKYKIIIFTTTIFLLASLIVTFSQPLKYKSQAKVLVVQEFGQEIDPYNASKMNEYLSGLLAKIIYSESFFNQTLNTNSSIDQEYFSGTQKKRIKKWNKTIKARSLYDSGIITLQVYHPNKDQAVQITRALIYTLKTKNNFYHSISNVDVRIIDSPSVSSWPVKPNIFLNSPIGIFFGLLFGVLYIFYEESRKIE